MEMTENKNRRRKSWWKWMLGIVIVIIALGTLQYFRMEKEAGIRREAMLAQEIKLREFYQEKGLSEEEIEKKLKEERFGSFNKDGKSSIFRSVMRTVRHTTGTGKTPMRFK